MTSHPERRLRFFVSRSKASTASGLCLQVKDDLEAATLTNSGSTSAVSAGVGFHLLAVSDAMRQVMCAAGIDDFFPLADPS